MANTGFDQDATFYQDAVFYQDAIFYQDAPAKINLALHITGQREDGYHLLDSLVVFSEFGDRISGSVADHYALTIKGPYAYQLKDCATDKNLITKAYDLLLGALCEQGIEVPHIHLTCEKNLPVASGIGGGSADAAATLRLLCKVWDVDVTSNSVHQVALKIGADVPMCLRQQALFARGIGDQISLIDDFAKLHLVLINPLENVSTPVIFKALLNKNNPALPSDLDIHTFDGVIEYLDRTRNDLQAPAISNTPAIQICLDALADTNAKIARMSGSGATCFGLYGSKEDAVAAAQILQDRFPNYFVIQTQIRG